MAIFSRAGHVPHMPPRGKTGAGRWYVGYGLPTSLPIPDSSDAHAVTIWRWDEGIEGQEVSDTAVGYTRGSRVWPTGGVIPRVVEKCLAAPDRLLRYRSNNYYQVNPDSFQVDARRVVKKIFAHEFGHAVGMLHLPPNNLTATTIMDPVRFSSNSQFYLADSSYAATSDSQFSIKARQP